MCNNYHTHDGCEVNNNNATTGEYKCAILTEIIVENLHHWLTHCIRQNCLGIFLLKSNSALGILLVIILTMQKHSIIFSAKPNNHVVTLAIQVERGATIPGF